MTPAKGDGKRIFVVNTTKFGVLTNWEEVHAARLEGRSADGIPHYFSKGDKIALSEAYIEKFGIARYFRESALDRDGLPSIEPIELYEKRKANEAKLALAQRDAGADEQKLEQERRELQAKLQAEYEAHAGATVLEQFTP